MITIIWSYRRNPVELAASCQTFGSCDLLQTFSDQSRQESPALRILRMKLTSTISTMIIIVIIAIVCLQIWEALCGRLFVLPARLKWNWYFACVIVVLYEKHKYEGRRARQLKTLTGGRREHAATVSWSVRIRCEYRVWADTGYWARSASVTNDNWNYLQRESWVINNTETELYRGFPHCSFNFGILE